MYQEDHFQPVQVFKTIQICLNGDNAESRILKYTFAGELKMDDVKRMLSQNMHINYVNLRLFTTDGVEIFKEDLAFIKNQTLLYATDQSDFDQSQSFSIYQIIKQLGEGGFGKVLLGRHKVTNELVAIKIIDTCKIGNAQDIDMVFREAELMKSLNHRNIVKILNCYTLPNMQVVIIMEYLQGGELLGYLEEKGHLDEYEARQIFQQIAESIYYCHGQKLIHRDLKLENILLQDKQSRVIKIVDFGIAGLANNLNVDKLDVGSLSYMAPEVLSGVAKQLGPPIDIWALGVILYGLLCGCLPFTRQSQWDTIETIISGYYTYPPQLQLSRELKDLVSRIFNIDPRQRIRMIDILNHSWMKIGGDNSRSGTQSYLSPNKKTGYRDQNKVNFSIYSSSIFIKDSLKGGVTFKLNKQEMLSQKNQTSSLKSTTQVLFKPNTISSNKPPSNNIYVETQLPITINSFESEKNSSQQQYPSIQIQNSKEQSSIQEELVPNQDENKVIIKVENTRYITKDYGQVLKKYKGKFKTFRCNLAPFLKGFATSKQGQIKAIETLDDPTTLCQDNQQYSKTPHCQQYSQKVAQDKYFSRNAIFTPKPENSKNLSKIIFHQQSKSLNQNQIQQIDKPQKVTPPLTQKQTNQRILHQILNSQLEGQNVQTHLSENPKVFEETNYSKPYSSVIVKQSSSNFMRQKSFQPWHEKAKLKKPEIQYQLQVDFMQRQRNMDKVFQSTFRTYLKEQMKRKNIMNIFLT